MCNCCWCGKRICSTYSDCVFLVLSNQHLTPMRCIILSYIPCLILIYVSTLFHKSYFLRKDLLNKNCAFWINLQICAVKFLIQRRIQTDIVLKVHFSLCNFCKYLVALFYILFKSLQISFFFIRSSWSQRRAITKLVFTFLVFVKAPNIFHFVIGLKYPKTHTYLRLNSRDSAWQ